MKIENLKQLQELIKLCRKLGVDAIEVDNIKFTLGQLPIKKTEIKDFTSEMFPEADIKIPQYNPVDKPEVSEPVKELIADVIKTDAISEEDLLFYSARGEQ